MRCNAGNPLSFFARISWMARSVRVSLLLEYIGAALGMAGSLWMASGVPSSHLAWWAWLASNTLLIAWATRVRARGILAMQAFYLTTSIIGILRH